MSIINPISFVGQRLLETDQVSNARNKSYTEFNERWKSRLLSNKNAPQWLKERIERAFPTYTQQYKLVPIGYSYL